MTLGIFNRQKRFADMQYVFLLLSEDSFIEKIFDDFYFLCGTSNDLSIRGGRRQFYRNTHRILDKRSYFGREVNHFRSIKIFK